MALFDTQFDYLALPGRYGSTASHWLSHWRAASPAFRWVEQAEWNNPVKGDWLLTLIDAIGRSEKRVVLVTHSLGGCLVAHLAQWRFPQVAGALLVAPYDSEAGSFPPGTIGFKPMPLLPLGFPSTLVSSRDDPYLSPDRAEFFASRWGSALRWSNHSGHLGDDLDLGVWSEGLDLLDELLSTIRSPDCAVRSIEA